MFADLDQVRTTLRAFRSRMLLLANGLPRRASGLAFGYVTAWALKEGIPEKVCSDEVFRIGRDLEASDEPL